MGVSAASLSGPSAALCCPLLSRRKELESRLVPGGSEFREVLAREVAVVEDRHAQQRAGLEEKMAAAKKQYAELEDEFRMALAIEATRFAEVPPTSFRA